MNISINNEAFLSQKKYCINKLTKFISSFQFGNSKAMFYDNTQNLIAKLNIPTTPIYEDEKREELSNDKPVVKEKKNEIQKLVALTFDGGPGLYTNRLLEILEKYNSKATFFISGNKIEGNEEIIKNIYYSNHQIANSGYSYTSFTNMDISLVRQEVYYTDKLLTSLGIASTKLVRPPYGYLKESIKTYIPLPLILWNIDTHDDLKQDKEFIKNKIRSEISDGSIVLMHDNNINTVDALDELLPELIKKGYTFVTIDKMCDYNNVSLEKGKVYVRINND